MVATEAPEEPGTPSSDELNLAMFMQAADAREFGLVLEGVLHPTWEETGEFGKSEYLKDARRVIGAMQLLGWRKP